MRTIIAGSRGISDLTLVENAVVQSSFIISEVISGGAVGVDSLGKLWAYSKSLPVSLFIPNWKEYGSQAGYLRNRQMAASAEALIAIWDGKSPGTKSMITIAREYKLHTFIYRA